MGRGGKRKGAGRPRKPRSLDEETLSISSPEVAPRDVPAATSAEGAIRRAQDLTNRMLAELEVSTSLQDEIEEMIVLETIGDHDQRRRRAMLAAVSLSSRAATLRILLSAAKTWVDLERAAKRPSPDVPKAAAAAKTAPAGPASPDDEFARLLAGPRSMN